MDNGLILLGAVTPQQHKRDQAVAKATQAGQRAIKTGQKIAKTAPRLSKAIVAAGQKALDKAKVSSKTAPGKQGKKGALAPTGPQGPKVATNPRGLGGRQRGMAVPVGPALNRGGPLSPRGGSGPTAGPMPGQNAGPAAQRPNFGPQGLNRRSASGKRAVLGEDSSQEEQLDLSQVDAVTGLADAATRAGEFVAEIQGYLEGIPPNLPLAARGRNILENFQFMFGDPIEKAITGETGVTKWTQGLLQSLQFVLDQRDGQPPVGVWEWVALANAYLSLHPPAAPPSDGTTSSPDGSTPAGTVAKVVVDPINITLASGMQQPFTAKTLDAAGAAVTPKAAVTWSVNPPTGTIDQSGTFSATAGGNYTITATADGVSGTATASVQASSGAATSPPPSGGSSSSTSSDTSSSTDSSTTPTPGDDPSALNMNPGMGYPDGGYADYPGYYPPGYPPGYADGGGGAYHEGDTYYVQDGGGPRSGRAPQGMELPPFTSEDESTDDFDGEFYGTEDIVYEQDLDADVEVGRGGGGGRGGRGGRGHHHHHGGRRWGRGGPWYGGPYYYGSPEVYLIDDLDDELQSSVDLDQFAKEVAKQIKEETSASEKKKDDKKKAKVGTDLECLGAEDCETW